MTAKNERPHQLCGSIEGTASNRPAMLGVTSNQAARLQRLAAQYLFAGVGLALVTLVCFRLRLELATTGFVYLVLITLVSMTGSFSGSAIIAIIAVACLAYFFAPPIFSLRIDSPHQVALVFFFLLTSLILIRLVVSARRQTEALRRSEEQWRDVFENNPTMYFMVDAADRVMAVNPFGAELLGYSVGELVGQPVLEVFYEPDREAVQRNVGICLEQVGRPRSWEARKVRKDGTVLWTRETAKAVARANGPIVLIACEDVTERKQVEAEKERLEAQLRQSQKLEAMGTLAGGIAHDFNNILSAILGYGELAQQAAPEGSVVRRYVDNVMHAGGRAKSLVERILAFSRSGMGERGPINVQAVIEEALELLAGSLATGVRLERHLEVGNAAIIADTTQLHQVAMNLCTNALQAMETGGVLEVVLDRADVARSCALSHGDLTPGTYVRLCVSDTGSGIPPHVLDRMFDPFFTTKGVGEGTGLGLSLVHGIVADLGGAIDVRTTVGCGTTFTIWLPIAGEATAPPIEAATEIQHGDHQTVMIVDDEKLLVALAEEILAELGYEPIGFNSSVAALKAIRAAPQRFDIVLTDETMPELSGTDLAREIRLLRPDIPIVLTSGYRGAPLQERARAAGIREVLRKPLQRRDIAECFGRVLR